MWWELKCDFYCSHLSVFKTLGKPNKAFHIYALKAPCLRINTAIFFFNTKRITQWKLFYGATMEKNYFIFQLIWLLQFDSNTQQPPGNFVEIHFTLKIPFFSKKGITINIRISLGKLQESLLLFLHNKYCLQWKNCSKLAFMFI